MDFKVYVQGNRVRLETQAGGRPRIVLYAPPYAYVLIPASKTGQRFRVEALQFANAGANFDFQSWLRNPAALRPWLLKQGAKRTGATRLNQVPVDIYASQKLTGGLQQVKAWLRRGDALPVRLEFQAKNLSGAASWRDYQRGRALSSSLFTVPADYKIRATQG